jgi:hypothetical protein
MWTPDPATIITAEAKATQATADAWTALRAQRDALLAACDYTQLPDVPDGATKAAWATYRQALRDLPANTPDPTIPYWPAAPS